NSLVHCPFFCSLLLSFLLLCLLSRLLSLFLALCLLVFDLFRLSHFLTLRLTFLFHLLLLQILFQLLPPLPLLSLHLRLVDSFVPLSSLSFLLCFVHLSRSLLVGLLLLGFLLS